MSELADLERRITSALERIGRGVEDMQASEAPAPDENSAGLQQALDDERTANAQLTERVRALKEKQDTTIADLQAEVDSLKARAEAAEAALSKVSATSEKLRDNNKALRDANAEGIAEPHLVNKSMLEELEALRAARSADMAEVDAILADLKNIVEGDAHA